MTGSGCIGCAISGVWGMDSARLESLRVWVPPPHLCTHTHFLFLSLAHHKCVCHSVFQLGHLGNASEHGPLAWLGAVADTHTHRVGECLGNGRSRYKHTRIRYHIDTAIRRQMERQSLVAWTCASMSQSLEQKLPHHRPTSLHRSLCGCACVWFWLCNFTSSFSTCLYLVVFFMCGDTFIHLYLRAWVCMGGSLKRPSLN